MSADEDHTYELVDPKLCAYNHGVGTLHIDRELKGHIACLVSEMTFPSRQPWPWFAIVWADGSKELAFEDDGAGWHTVRKLDAGHLDHFGPRGLETRRFLWMSLRSSTNGPACVYDFAWLPTDEAAVIMDRTELVDSDF